MHRKDSGGRQRAVFVQLWRLMASQLLEIHQAIHTNQLRTSKPQRKSQTLSMQRICRKSFIFQTSVLDKASPLVQAVVYIRNGHV